MMSASATRKSFRISTWPAALGIRCEQSITLHERRYLLLALAIFALLSAYCAYTVPLWYDEFFTLFISQIASLPKMLRAMPDGGQPPMQYLLTHLSLRLFGETEFAIRLPEMLAYMAAGLLIYKIVRRHGTAIQALFALAMLLGATINREHAYTARPYGLLIAFTALTFYSWQTATLREHHRLLPLCGVALGIGGAILSHYFGVVHTGLLLAAGETARLIERRRLDGWMIAAITAGLTTLALTLSLARQTNLVLNVNILNSTNFWARPSPIHLLFYLFMVSLPLLFLVAIFACMLWPGRTLASRASALHSVPAHEWAAAGALALLLPILLLLTKFLTGYFIMRYAISCSLGLALLAGWALPHFGRLRTIAQPLLALSTLCFLLFIATTILLNNIHLPIWKAQPGTEAVSTVLLSAPAGVPIVVANAFDYVPEWWYAPASIQQRLVYLSDIQYAVHQPDFFPENSLTSLHDYIPLRIADYAPFVSSHSTFLLFKSGLPRLTWIVPRLANAGWRLTPIAQSGGDVLYRVDRP
jgi:4-amino-4-deoxy-L-arabinose transferase-like glycosyltransferase